MSKKVANYRIHKALADYLKDKDLTKLCRFFRRHGITKRAEICSLFKEHYTSRYMHRHGVDYFDVSYNQLKYDLDEPRTGQAEPIRPWNLLIEMTRNKNAGSYKKVLILGNKHIYWASPIYGHKDYNKSIWADNTPKNRERMRVINNFLNK